MKHFLKPDGGLKGKQQRQERGDSQSSCGIFLLRGASLNAQPSKINTRRHSAKQKRMNRTPTEIKNVGEDQQQTWPLIWAAQGER